MVRLVLVFVISALYFSVGGYHIWKTGRKEGQSRAAYVAYGAVWMVLGLSYFFAAVQQVLHELDRPVADRTFFYLNSTCAIGVIIPYYYFASYLLWGGGALNRRLLALAAALFAVGTGLIWSTPVEVQEFGWGSLWSFEGRLVESYFQLVGALPLLASLGGFMLFVYPRDELGPARYRLAVITLSFALVLAAWTSLVVISNPSNIAAAAFSLASGLAAHFAYFPPPFVRRRLGSP